MIDHDKVEQDTTQELCGIFGVNEAAIRNQTLFNNYVKANIKRAEAIAAKEERDADLNNSEKHINEIIWQATIEDAEKVQILVGCLEKIKALKEEGGKT